MSHNPFLGSGISLISKKNIRYEGTLYSISETDATVALQNVRSYGTEGREKSDPSSNGNFVPPQDTIHPYLLFRGCDIKDLHVHESKGLSDQNENDVSTDIEKVTTGAVAGKTTSSPPPSDTTAAQSNTTPAPPPGVISDPAINGNRLESNLTEDSAVQEHTDVSKTSDNIFTPAVATTISTTKESNEKIGDNNPENQSLPTNKNNKTKADGNINNKRRGRKNDPKKMVGSGASLLHRKARGTVEGEGPDVAVISNEDFDFESKLAEFEKDVEISGENEKNSNDEEENATRENATGETAGTAVYQKDDFFDSISCDVLDKQNGIDNRLRGADERNLNTETFGATSLGTNRRGGRRGRGRGGRGRGRGRGDGGGRRNNRWSRDGEGSQKGGYGRSKQYGDGGISSNSRTKAWNTVGGQ